MTKFYRNYTFFAIDIILLVQIWAAADNMLLNVDNIVLGELGFVPPLIYTSTNHIRFNIPNFGVV